MQHFLILFLWSNLEKLDYFLKANFYNLLSWSVGFDNNKLYIGFPGGASGKEHACPCRRPKRLGFNPGLARSPGEGNGNPLQYSCLENLWTEEPGGLLFIGSHRVRHDWSDFACMHWRRKWQPPPVFLPGESQGRRSLVGCPLWGCTKSDTTIKSHSSSSSSSRWRTFKTLWEYLTPYIKSNSIWIKDQNITAKGTKFPEENIRQWFLKYDPTH